MDSSVICAGQFLPLGWLRGFSAVRIDGMGACRTRKTSSIRCLEYSKGEYMAALLLAPQQKQNIPETIPWHHGGPGILATSSQELLFLAPKFPRCSTFVNCIIPSRREQGAALSPSGILGDSDQAQPPVANNLGHMKQNMLQCPGKVWKVNFLCLLQTCFFSCYFFLQRNQNGALPSCPTRQEEAISRVQKMGSTADPLLPIFCYSVTWSTVSGRASW